MTPLYFVSESIRVNSFSFAFVRGWPFHGPKYQVWSVSSVSPVLRVFSCRYCLILCWRQLQAAAGAEAQVNKSFSARLKSCPDTNHSCIISSTAWTSNWSTLEVKGH